jgi:hypothetical protein
MKNKMKKEIKDYLHFYLKSGISVFVFADNSITAEDSLSDGFLTKYIENHPNGVYNPVLTTENYERFLRDGYKQILRPDTDTTSEESQEIQMQEGKGITQSWAFITKILIDKGFDVFGLIEAGLAIDKTKIDAIRDKVKGKVLEG